MKKAVQGSLQKARVHEGIKDGILSVSNAFLKLKDIGNAILAAEPVAAMAWSGICAIIPVRSFACPFSGFPRI